MPDGPPARSLDQTFVEQAVQVPANCGVGESQPLSNRRRGRRPLQQDLDDPVAGTAGQLGVGSCRTRRGELAVGFHNTIVPKIVAERQPTTPAARFLDSARDYAGRRGGRPGQAVPRSTGHRRRLLDISRDEVTAILGPNGAGKTTTVEICEGTARRTRGRYACSASIRATVSSERVSASCCRTVASPPRPDRETLRQYASFHTHPHDPEALLDLVGLTAVAATPYRRLSGGQQQRLSLALALLGRPELVFLDEPTAGLDPQARQTTWRIIEDLRRDGVTVVLTTHSMEEAERLADEVVILDHGRVVAAGTPAALTGAGPQESWRFRGPPGRPLASLQSALPAQPPSSRRPGAYAVSGEVTPPCSPPSRRGAPSTVSCRRPVRRATQPRRRVPRSHRSRVAVVSVISFVPRPAPPRGYGWSGRRLL